LKSLETEKESRKPRQRDEQTGDRAAPPLPRREPLALTHAAPGLEPSPVEAQKGVTLTFLSRRLMLND